MIPTVTLWSNASEYGTGVYNDKGMAWRWHIRLECHGVQAFILLELITSATSIYMTIQQLGQGSNTLAFTDISSALVGAKSLIRTSWRGTSWHCFLMAGMEPYQK